MDSPNLYSIAEAAKLIGVSTKTLQRWESDGIMTPAYKVGKRRKYSEEQVKNCHKNFDPDTAVTSLTAADIENLWLRCGTIAKTQIRKVDPIKEQFESLWCKLVSLSNIICVKSVRENPLSDRVANTILAAPDLCQLISQVNYGMQMVEDTSDKPISRLGTCSSVWKVYRCNYMMPGQLMIGSTMDGTFDVTSSKLASLSVESVILF